MNTLITKATVGCVVFAAMAMANAAEAKTCRSEYLKHYVHGPSHKAMATTGGRNPLGKSSMSCGTAWGYGTTQEAINEALRQCRVSDRKYKDKGVCQITEAK